MNLRYICKNCGGEASYNEKTKEIICSSCGSKEFNYVLDELCPKYGGILIYNEFENKIICENCNHISNTESLNVPEKNEEKINRENDLETFEGNSVSCQGCGAKLIVEENTSSFKCPYCNSIINISNNIIGVYKPDAIIPFKYDIKDAQKAFEKWCKKGFFLQKNFKYADRIKEIKPMYVPFWIYDIENIGTINFNATKVRHYSKGDYNYTETSYYNCARDIDIFLNKIPCDASKKLDDKSMDLLEPFNMDELKDFNVGYLSGNLTEKYDYNDQELLSRAYKRGKEYVIKYLENDIQREGFSAITINKDMSKMKNKDAKYILLPIWILTYNYKDKDYQFLMNGQTGKVIGKPPIDNIKVFFTGTILAVIMTILEYIIFFV